jgi:3-phosphoshikimate 1-carboxyvinyltransferase
MSYKIKVSPPKDKSIKGSIKLSGSKSISNRALLIRALCNENFDIQNLSDSDDSIAMQQLLAQEDGEYNAGHAGTTFRFLTAYFAFKEGSQFLTGSARMQQRPIKALVEALNSIGAHIEYAAEEGYPPLKIHSPKSNIADHVAVNGSISSQYLSALLMIAPTLPNGLKLTIEGELVSRPYLQMTLDMMSTFGIAHTWVENTITVPHQSYVGSSYFVEADWSGASYYYSLAAIADDADITLHGLHTMSMQGDSAIMQMGEKFGVITTKVNNTTLQLKSQKYLTSKKFFEYDFVEQPDIAQTVFAMCAGCQYSGLFTGLQTLYIKETDRVNAFKTELAKVGVQLNKVPKRFKQNDEREFFMLEGDLSFGDSPSFDTYHDHRMAMSLAPLGLLHDVIINDAGVVSKSYPAFWEDLASLGLVIERID